MLESVEHSNRARGLLSALLNSLDHYVSRNDGPESVLDDGISEQVR